MNSIKLNIDKPCHENWDAMTPTQRGRFCNACAKEVIDFTVMSDTQVLNYLSTLNGKGFCGSAFPDQLNRPIIMPAPPAKPKPWYWSYFMMGVFLFSKLNVKAQTVKGEMAYPPVKQNCHPIMTGKVKCTPSKDTLHPKQLDTVVMNGYLPQKRVDITGAVSIIQLGAIRPRPVGVEMVNNSATNIDNNKTITIGGMHATNQPPPLYIIDGVIANGMNKTNLRDIESMEVLKDASVRAIYGNMAAGGVIIITTKKRKIIDTLKILPKKIETIFTDSLKIFPNPVKRGNTFSITTKLKQLTNYKVEVVNNFGEIMLVQQIYADAKKITQQLQSNSSWSAGLYVVRILDAQNKLVSISKIMVIE